MRAVKHEKLSKQDVSQQRHIKALKNIQKENAFCITILAGGEQT